MTYTSSAEAADSARIKGLLGLTAPQYYTRPVTKMGARRDPIYSPVEKMEEENSNTTSQKKKEGQRKRINLMIGLVCGLALFAGVAILSKRPTKG